MNNENLSQKVCKTIKKLRLRKGISQEDLALAADLDRSYISGIERMQKNITFCTLEKIIPHISNSDIHFLEEFLADLKND